MDHLFVGRELGKRKVERRLHPRQRWSSSLSFDAYTHEQAEYILHGTDTRSVLEASDHDQSDHSNAHEDYLGTQEIAEFVDDLVAGDSVRQDHRTSTTPTSPAPDNPNAKRFRFEDAVTTVLQHKPSLRDASGNRVSRCWQEDAEHRQQGQRLRSSTIDMALLRRHHRHHHHRSSGLGKQVHAILPKTHHHQSRDPTQQHEKGHGDNDTPTDLHTSANTDTDQADTKATSGSTAGKKKPGSCVGRYSTASSLSTLTTRTSESSGSSTDIKTHADAEAQSNAGDDEVRIDNHHSDDSVHSHHPNYDDYNARRSHHINNSDTHGNPHGNTHGNPQATPQKPALLQRIKRMWLRRTRHKSRSESQWSDTDFTGTDHDTDNSTDVGSSFSMSLEQSSRDGHYRKHTRRSNNTDQAGATAASTHQRRVRFTDQQSLRRSGPGYQASRDQQAPATRMRRTSSFSAVPMRTALNVASQVAAESPTQRRQRPRSYTTSHIQAPRPSVLLGPAGNMCRGSAETPVVPILPLEQPAQPAKPQPRQRLRTMTTPTPTTKSSPLASDPRESTSSTTLADIQRRLSRAGSVHSLAPCWARQSLVPTQTTRLSTQQSTGSLDPHASSTTSLNTQASCRLSDTTNLSVGSRTLSGRFASSVGSDASLCSVTSFTEFNNEARRVGEEIAAECWPSVRKLYQKLLLEEFPSGDAGTAIGLSASVLRQSMAATFSDLELDGLFGVCQLQPASRVDLTCLHNLVVAGLLGRYRPHNVLTATSALNLVYSKFYAKDDQDLEDDPQADVDCNEPQAANQSGRRGVTFSDSGTLDQTAGVCLAGTAAPPEISLWPVDDEPTALDLATNTACQFHTKQVWFEQKTVSSALRRACGGTGRGASVEVGSQCPEPDDVTVHEAPRPISAGPNARGGCFLKRRGKRRVFVFYTTV
eukprot:m.166378 g.166378  ORF g.166378 m.166378 type:complete len:928 (+) comp17752_c2_seq2:360-3143(+)